MIYTVTKCEMCEHSFRFSAYQRPYERDIPAGWYSVFQGNLLGSEGWHFCSKTCLLAWAHTPAKIVRPACDEVLEP